MGNNNFWFDKWRGSGIYGCNLPKAILEFRTKKNM